MAGCISGLRAILRMMPTSPLKVAAVRDSILRHHRVPYQPSRKAVAAAGLCSTFAPGSIANIVWPGVVFIPVVTENIWLRSIPSI